MSIAPLPKLVDPLKMVDQRVDLAGSISLEQLERTHGALLEKQGELTVKLAFDRDQERIPVVSGAITGELVMQCQRCLEPVRIELAAEVKLGVVFSEEQAKNLPACYDPLVIEGHELSLWSLIEDEVLLNLPIVALHPDNACSLQQTGPDEVEESRANPFSVLAQLKGEG